MRKQIAAANWKMNLTLQQGEQLLNDINHSGKIFLSHTKLNERFVIRMCIGQTYTEKKHVELAWNIIQEYAKKITF